MKYRDRIIYFVAAVIAVALLFFLTHSGKAAELPNGANVEYASPPGCGAGDPMTCDAPKALNDHIDHYQCSTDQPPFVPRQATEAHPIGFLVDHFVDKPRIRVHWSGYQAKPDACMNPDFAEQGYVVVKLCPEYFPDVAKFKADGVSPWGYGGFWLGNESSAYRSSLAIGRAVHDYGGDAKKGIELRGKSYGAMTAEHQVMMLHKIGSHWADKIGIIHADIGAVFFQDPWPPNDNVRTAWNGFDRKALDIREQVHLFENIYLRYNGASNDGTVGPFDLAGMAALCNEHKLQCVLTMHAGGHATAEPGFFGRTQHLYVTHRSDFEVRLDRPGTAFNNGTADFLTGDRGHYGIGNWYKNAVDKEKKFSLDIGYTAFRDFGKGVPDMPDTNTVDITVRRIQNLSGKVTWRYGTQKGTGEIRDGEITIERLTLTSGDNRTLTLEPVVLEEPNTGRTIVYTRQPAARERVNAEIEDASNWQHKTGVARINTGLSESDVVLENLTTGDIKVLYDCTTEEAKCVAQEARVSPDGENIAFSVGIGDYFQEVRSHEGTLLPIREIHALKQSHIWVYNVPTGKLRQITHGNHQDRYPEWCGNDCLVFSSDREGIRPMEAVFTYHEDPAKRVWPATAGRTHFAVSLQIWQMDSNGGNMKNVTPHESSALAPAVFSNGDILYSCWWGHGQRSYKKTPQNMYMICRVDSNGADGTVIQGAHGSPYLSAQNLTDATGGPELTEFRALRSAREVFKRVLMDTGYYRGNHVGGMGTIWAQWYLDPRVEGTHLLCALSATPHKSCEELKEHEDRGEYQARYVHSSLVNMTPPGQDQDALTRFCDGKACGKFGYPAPLANTETDYMATWGDGNCYELTRDHQANTEAMGGRPPCHMQIVQIKGARTLLDPSKPDDPRSYALNGMTDPFDSSQLAVLSGGKEWNKWDASEVATYQAFFGQPEPERKPPIEPGECYVSAANARLAELAPFFSEGGKVRPEHPCQYQGCAVDHSKFSQQMHQLAIYTVEHWRGPVDPNRMNNLGYESITRYGHQELESDGSIRMKVPCRTPLRFVAENKMGLAIAIDETTPRLLQKGEELVCHRCHGGHSEEQAAEIGMSAEDAFAQTIAGKGLGVKELVLDTNGPVTFDRIKPLVDKCNTCHTDRADYPYSQWTWDPMRVIRPCTSDMVCKFALNSPMFQHCMPTPEHSTGATGLECLMLGRWIDSGVQF